MKLSIYLKTIKKIPMTEKIVDFKNSKIIESDCKVLRELEKLTKKQFLFLDQIDARLVTGFTVNNNRVIGVTIKQCNLKTFPTIIEDFTSIHIYF